ncbi:MAG: HlyD family type I secretion periplasmic adaptor subunit, partial [Geminicoccaceae bacterium]
LLLFFGGFGSWAAFVPLSGAAIAPAVVAPDGYRKTIQHLEGGIVAEIRVREGATVEAGDVLVVLDDTRARAEFAAASAKLAGLQARAARLDAQQTGAAGTVFPAELVARAAEDRATADLLRAENAALVAQRQALTDQIAVRDRRIEQARSDLVAYEGGLASIDSQAALLDEQITTVEDLLHKGLERRPRLLDLLRARAALDGQRIAIVGDAARTRELINATAAERVALGSGQANDVALQLADARASTNQLQAAVDAARDQLDRTVIRAPIAGEVVDLRIHTPGGVIQPGDALMDLVPRDEPLVLEARVSPKDIDVVHPGLLADVHLLAYHTRNLPRLRGEVRQVSGDRLVDTKSGEPYYSARIVVDMAAVHDLAPEVRLTAGMPAEALILTGERTLLGYLTDPIRQSFRRALRES